MVMKSATLTAYRRISQFAFILFIFLIPMLNILRIDCGVCVAACNKE